MIGLFKDVGLQNPLGISIPKRFLVPTRGGSKATTLWLGDPYYATVTAVAAIGASTITLDQTSEFLSAGSATVNGVVVSYTGTTATTLTGVSGVTAGIPIGAVIVPRKKYVANSNLQVFADGILSSDLTLSFALVDDSFGFPGMPLILGFSSILTGVANAYGFQVQANFAPGPETEYTDFGVSIPSLFARDFSDNTAIDDTEVGSDAFGYCYGFRRDQSLPIPTRVLPANRQVAPNMPGFIIGQYRWRDEDNLNAVALLPTNWGLDPEQVGLEKFVAGIGDDIDLEPTTLVEVEDSIYQKILAGHYFTGAYRYYLPANPSLEFLSSLNTTLQLSGIPLPQKPIFIGTYRLDSQGFYERDVQYEYVGRTSHLDGTPRTDLPPYYFTFDWPSRTATLSQAQLDNQLIYVGAISGQVTDYFDIPTYPVDSIHLVYADPGLGNPFLSAALINFDREKGTLTITNPTGSGPSIAGSSVGMPVFAICSPAVAVLYDTPGPAERILSNVDLNPAFSGLSGGFIYLQHTRQKAASIALTCDKPQVDVPRTLSQVIDLVAYGPVYFENDYALLSATAYSNIPGETIPNALLQVVVGDDFEGLLNYQDPTEVAVQVVTGGDGVANLVYTPPSGTGGIWMPTIPAVIPIISTSLGGIATTYMANDTLVLPALVPYSEMYDPSEGWLVTTYNVRNNDPLYGEVGAVPAYGEVPWTTSGTPGAPGYKTNGSREAWRSGVTVLIYPIEVRDETGKKASDVGFSGNVKCLVYGQAVDTSGSVGAYFITTLMRMQISLQLVGSNVMSNPLLLELAAPDEILETPWLIVNDGVHHAPNESTYGRINIYRLGWTRPVIRGV